MGKGFTPMIGLAVVVALALAAVFGAMSLANPAYADIAHHCCLKVDFAVTAETRLWSGIFHSRSRELGMTTKRGGLKVD